MFLGTGAKKCTTMMWQGAERECTGLLLSFTVVFTAAR